MNNSKIKTDLRKLLRDAAGALPEADSPGTDAYEIARLVFGFNRTDILLCPVRELSEEDIGLFRGLIKKRAGGYPLQYILGKWDFFGFTFFVEDGVLIPRPETEQIAENACKFLKTVKNAVVFDICSGTGCIGLSVAANNQSCKVYLFDISEKALTVSEKNKKNLRIENAEILNYDIFTGFDGKALPRPDVILCNPPYVTEDEYKSLAKEIFFEPKNAVVCGGDGLDFYRCLAEKWLPYINPGGYFMLECGEGQPEKVESLIDKQFRTASERDIYGVLRFVSGIKATPHN